MDGWLFEALRVGLVVATLILMGWFCFKMRRTPLATTYWIGSGIYALAHARLFSRRRRVAQPDDDGDGEAPVPALVGAGPRGPRTAADAQAWPRV